MHSIIESEVEDYLSGSASRDFHLHLAQCAECRAEVEGMQQISRLLGSLRADQPMAPPLGFTQRLERSLREQRSRSFWSLFSTDQPFVARLAFASVLSLAVLGGFLATQDDSMAKGDHTPEAVMASHDLSPTASEQQHLNGMLVTLANYRVR